MSRLRRGGAAGAGTAGAGGVSADGCGAAGPSAAGGATGLAPSAAAGTAAMVLTLAIGTGGEAIETGRQRGTASHSGRRRGGAGRGAPPRARRGPRSACTTRFGAGRPIAKERRGPSAIRPQPNQRRDGRRRGADTLSASVANMARPTEAGSEDRQQPIRSAGRTRGATSANPAGGGTAASMIHAGSRQDDRSREVTLLRRCDRAASATARCWSRARQEDPRRRRGVAGVPACRRRSPGTGSFATRPKPGR